jgi:RNA polymerase sigma-70 factor (ECF subfamily)
MQEAFVNSYVKLKQFAARSSFKTWIIKIMLNQCFHKAHKHSYQKEHVTEISPDTSSFMFSSSNHSDNGKSVINKELNNIIESCLRMLPDDYRITFALRELTGLSVAETAEIMHTSTSNVKVRLNRAKVLLRKEIEKTYSPEDIYEFNLIYCDQIVDAVMKKIYSMEGTGQPSSNQ